MCKNYRHYIECEHKLKNAFLIKKKDLYVRIARKMGSWLNCMWTKWILWTINQQITLSISYFWQSIYLGQFIQYIFLHIKCINNFILLSLNLFQNILQGNKHEQIKLNFIMSIALKWRMWLNWILPCETISGILNHLPKQCRTVKCKNVHWFIVITTER